MRAEFLLPVALAVGLSGAARAAETIIRVGDTIAISAFGLPELDRKVVVEKSGEISYPLLGLIKAAGASPSDLRKKIVEGLVQGGLARDPKVGVEIAAREQFYVTGDVSKPGAHPYVLNVTVRSAVALSGGLDAGGAKGTVNPAEIEGRYETLALEYVKQRAAVRAIEASLAGRKNVDFDDFADLPVKKDVVRKLNDLVLDEVRMRADDTKSEKAYLQNVIAETQTQIAALVGRQHAEEESVGQETEQVAKFKILADHGTIVQERLLNQKRTMLAQQSKLFETTATLASTRRLLEELQHKLKGVDEARRLTSVKELQDAYIASAAASSRLVAVRQQLNVKGDRSRPHFVIYRENGDVRIRVAADEDFEVQPGDIVEVRFGVAATMAEE